MKSCLTPIIVSLLLAQGANAEIYYASPAGAGTGMSSVSPFAVADFWSVAKPGDVLILLDGKYTGSQSMINPPQGLSGTQSAPIQIRAQNDGKVEIDGEGARRPVYLFYNDYFILEGFDAHSSNNAVVELHRSNNNIVRRVCAWDAGDVNTGNCFAAHNGTHNLFEDCAGWGRARKVFTNSQGGDYTIFRRCWGEWEQSTVIGPKMTYTFCYNSYDTILENCIGTWNSNMSSPDQPYGIFSMDRNDENQNSNSKILGSIAYLTGDQRFDAKYLFFVTKLNAVEIRDCLAYIEPGTHGSVMPYALYPNSDGAPSTLKAQNLTSVGGAESFIDPTWNPQNIYHSLNGTELLSNGKSMLQVEGGANVMNRYVDGNLTSEPLWPWPMNQRIIDAMQRSGRPAVDVTEVIFDLTGQVPLTTNDLAVTDIKFANIGETEALDIIEKGTPYDLYIFFNSTPENWSSIAYADLWVNTPFYTAGDSLNRGGAFYSSDSYVMSFSVSTPGIWARETEGALDWRYVSGTAGLYIDDSSSGYELNPEEGWAKVRIHLLETADVTSWTAHAYIKDMDGSMSEVYERSIAVESRSRKISPTANLIINPRSPVTEGDVTVEISVSEDVVDMPALFFIDSNRIMTELPLSGQVPGRVFTGMLSIEQGIADGIGKFILPVNTLTDQAGNKGNDILSGRYLVIDKIAPVRPANLSGFFGE